jgi:hypothetical protein
MFKWSNNYNTIMYFSANRGFMQFVTQKFILKIILRILEKLSSMKKKIPARKKTN